MLPERTLRLAEPLVNLARTGAPTQTPTLRLSAPRVKVERMLVAVQRRASRAHPGSLIWTLMLLRLAQPVQLGHATQQRARLRVLHVQMDRCSHRQARLHAMLAKLGIPTTGRKPVPSVQMGRCRRQQARRLASPAGLGRLTTDLMRFVQTVHRDKCRVQKARRRVSPAKPASSMAVIPRHALRVQTDMFNQQLDKKLV